MAKRLSEMIDGHVWETIPKVAESAKLVQESMTQVIPSVLKLSETVSKVTVLVH